MNTQVEQQTAPEDTNKAQITLSMLRQWGACSGGKSWFSAKFPQGAEYGETMTALYTDKKYGDARWLARNVFDKAFSKEIVISDVNSLIALTKEAADGELSSGYGAQDHLFAQKVCEIDYPDWSTKAAKEERDAAYTEGRIPLLTKEVEDIRAMHSVVWRDTLGARAFSGGKAEQSLVWRDEEFGIWCRLRPDYMPNNAARIFDYKTAADGSPAAFMKDIYNRGYHQQAAWYLDGYEAVTKQRPREFWFVVQEKTAPFLLLFYHMDELSLEIGRTLNRQAKGIFAWCLRNNRWPGYQPEVDGKTRFFITSPPAWMVREYEFKNEHGAYEPPEIKQKEVA